jgi:Type II secretion system (T2SS), protein G
MKLAAALIVLCVATSSPQARDGELERIVKDKLQSMQDVTAALKTVTDAKTAEAAVSKMDASLQRLIVCEEVLADQKILEILRKNKLDDKYGKQLADTQADLQKETDRLAKQKILTTIEQATWKRWQTQLKENDAANEKARIAREGPRIERATLQIKSLETVVTAYFVRHGAYADSLKALTQRQPDGGPAMLVETGLLDPWERPYLYDPKQRNPKTDRPLIWSQGPNPGQPGSIIANWEGDFKTKTK